MLDLLGQTINVGDFVVGGTSSSFTNYGKPHVVTRIGSTQDVQLNASGYAKASLLVVVTEQYKYFKGDDACYALRTEYRDSMNYDPVPAPKVVCRYLVLQFTNPFVSGTSPSPQYRILAVQGKNEGERLRSACPVIKQMKGEYSKSEFAQECSLKVRTKRMIERYDGYHYFFGSAYSGLETISKKSLDDLGLTPYIGQVINTDHPAYVMLQALQH